MKNTLTLLMLTIGSIGFSQTDTRIYDIINAVSAERIESDVTTLVNFGTRHTLSDTVSTTRGIGAARRWIKSEFEKISGQYVQAELPTPTLISYSELHISQLVLLSEEAYLPIGHAWHGPVVLVTSRK